MSLFQKNKNSTSSTNLTKKQLPQPKQTKNKTCIIKLEVNKLFKSQATKQNFHKITKSQYLNQHNTPEIMPQHQNSLQKQVELKPEKKIIKTFEELYFEKIKLLRLHQNEFVPFLNNQEKVALTQKMRPSSCKNIVSIKPKNRPNFPQPQSTKNLITEENKENVFAQKNDAYVIHQKENKFFKKKDPKITESEMNYKYNMPSSIEKVPQKMAIKKEEFHQDQKCKKILKIKRPSKINKEQTSEKSENSFFERQSIQKPKKMFLDIQKQLKFIQKVAKPEEKTLFSPISSCLNPSVELKTFKLSTPSSSAQKPVQISFTETRFDEIIHSKINHSLHEHIWDAVECFFSLDEFEFVLQELGFKDSLHNKEINFYVNKLWEHLGGDLYGGVVRKNMREFLNIVLEDDGDISSEIVEVLTSKEQKPLDENFIDKGSLKLVALSQRTKDQIRRFYFPFRISKIASQIHHLHIKENSGEKLHNSVNSIETLSGQTKEKLSSEKANSSNRSHMPQIPEPKQIYLENNAYLDTISVKNRHQDLSPCMIPKNYESTHDLALETDFSPKMPAQKYEPFKSTVLSKDDFVLEKLSTEQQEDNQTSKKIIRKPLLSVDVNLGEGILEKILVYEDQNPYQISLQLKERYNIDEELREKFEKMLRNHLNTLLFKIQEVSQELFEDSLELKDQCDLKDFVLMEKE